MIFFEGCMIFAWFIFGEIFLQRGYEIFLLRDCVIYCMKRLHNFVCEEVACLFVWRGFLEKKFSDENSFLVGKKSFFKEILFDNVVELVGGGSVINRAYPV